MKTAYLIYLSIFFGVMLQACNQPPDDPATANADAGSGISASDQAARTITTVVLREYIAAISADRFEGRGPGSRGDMMARDYLIDQLAGMGYSPGAASNDWQQVFDLIGVKAQVPEHWVFTADAGDLELKKRDQFIAASGVQTDKAVLEQAEIVFAGYGIVAPEYDWDDFKGRDLRGKVLLMLNNDPDWDDDLFAGNTRLYYGRWTYKYESAARQGAAGAIIIHTRASAGYPFQVVQTSWDGEQFELPAGEEPRIQVAAWVTEAAARELVVLAGHDLDSLVAAAKSREFVPQPLGITTSLTLENTTRTVQTANVLGLLPGSDPELADEAVIYTAHHDHLGTGMPDADGDNIYNGALDNGAGMAQVLAIARAFSALPEAPRRSVLIAFVGAEEQGLLGSAYYAAHPTFPPGRIAANINYDSGNIWGRTGDLAMLGYGKSTLDTVVKQVAASQGRTVKPDQLPDRGYFYRSDQFNFAKIGVPAMYLKTGTDFIGRPPGWGREQIEAYEDNHYHQPSDELQDDWNLDGMVEDARLGFHVGLITANADVTPAWYPGDEFEAIRLQSLTDNNDGKHNPVLKIHATEAAFAAMARDSGIKQAFLAYASEEAVLNRNNRLVRGKQEIAAYFDSQPYTDIRLEWAPDFIDVAVSADLGYSYGHYTFSATDASGNTIQDSGIFHTVWKRQADGQWKFVWD
jgi:Zn-dependent M28 family amino/carboxypeptidase/ketosteroid isomerase-like protein